MTTPEPRRYHYVITLQFEARNGVQRLTWEHGTITPAPGESRSDVFRQIFDHLAERGANPVPLFFSLEPDDLAVPDEPPKETG